MQQVILLHGLGRTPWSMLAMENALGSDGFHVYNPGYPSRRHDIVTLSRSIYHYIKKNGLEKAGELYFVTHSLGGIIVRTMHNLYPELPIGRVVMLAPPNQGSELADILSPHPVFRIAFGPALRELTTDKYLGPASLGKVDFPLGVVAGNTHLFPFSRWLGEEHDGLVGVERTKVEGMKDFIILPYGHTWIMEKKDVIHQVVHFLASGNFI